MTDLKHLAPAELRLRLRNAKAREAMLLEALAPFAAAWPLHRARVLIQHQPHEGLALAELRAVGPFYPITLCGRSRCLRAALTGADLREAFEAVSALCGEVAPCE